jgi:hypothetical protein
MVPGWDIRIWVDFEDIKNVKQAKFHTGYPAVLPHKE